MICVRERRTKEMDHLMVAQKLAINEKKSRNKFDVHENKIRLNLDQAVI